MSKSNYTEVGGGDFGTRWDITATEKNNMSFNPENPENIKEGYYLSCSDVQGKDGFFKVYSIQEVEKDGTLGLVYSLRGDKVLNDKFTDIKIGSKICVEYQGRKFKKGYENNKQWSQTNSYHVWFVGVDKNAPSYNEFVNAVNNGSSPAQPAVKSEPVKTTLQATPAPTGGKGIGNNTDFLKQGAAGNGANNEEEDLPW